MSSSPPLHPSLSPLAFLVGTWEGEGEGFFPTISPFRYREQLLFSHSGKPALSYSQKTWKLDSPQPMHAESGFWKLRPDGSVEVVIAHVTGIVEVQKGTYDAENKVITLKSDLVGNASKVKEITRVFKLHDGKLSYVVEMATKDNSLQPHLKAVLSKL